MLKHSIFVFVFAMSIIVSVIAHAQLREPAISPVFNDDRTVTFRLKAPEADDVKLFAEFLPEPKPMVKNAEGVWALTVGPAEPKMYYYNFLVDGVSVMDPQNPAIATSLLPCQSFLSYPGDELQFYDQKDVTHGILHTHHYFSELEQVSRSIIVYTPPDYDPQKEYPVLYLLHGYTDNERGWVDLGRANFIMDNLIAEKAAVPMIVVLPFGYSEPQEGDNGEGWGDWFHNVVPRFERDVMNEIIPFVESSYSTADGTENRAIAGLSMGGSQSLYIGLKNIEMFSWIGGFSTALSKELRSPYLSNPSNINDHCKLLWIACGKEDWVFDYTNEFISALKEKGIVHEYYVTEGTHTWWVWRNYLRDFAPRLFR